MEVERPGYMYLVANGVITQPVDTRSGWTKPCVPYRCCCYATVRYDVIGRVHIALVVIPAVLATSPAAIVPKDGKVIFAVRK